MGETYRPFVLDLDQSGILGEEVGLREFLETGSKGGRAFWS